MPRDDAPKTRKEAFLAEIRERPDDDFPRLQFADWLEENGEPERAEFIRVQCELAKRIRVDLPAREPRLQPLADVAADVLADHADPEGAALRARERELLADAAFWVVDLPVAGMPANGTIWRRGFIEGIACPAEHWLARADDIVRATPLREVTLTTWPELEWCGDAFKGDSGLKLAGRSASVLLGWAHQDGSPNSQWTRRYVPELLAAEWPRIKFTLPRGGAA